MQDIINDLSISKLDCFKSDKGTVMHAIKKNSNGFAGFGEAYFSTVNFNNIKGWKKHKQMIMNLVVPVGSVRFYIHDERNKNSEQSIKRTSILLGANQYLRLTIPNGVWFAFQGVGKDVNLVLNISNIIHDPNECKTLPIDHEKFKGIDFIT
tara:strand:+ start:2289 stop:2744 length:456 start_codon:yes stop_codon:yes gene_type:complete